MKVSPDGRGGAPRLPHERDEASDSSGAPGPDPLMEIAREDAKSDKVPTDRGNESDETYRKNLRDKTPGSERDAGGSSK